MLGDLDTFFVEVERLHMPHLRGRPVVIGGRPGGRGVVAACSYEAREFGIRSAMPMAEAYRRVWRAGGVVVDGPFAGNRVEGLNRNGAGIRRGGTQTAQRRLDLPTGAGLRGRPVHFLHTNLFGNYDRYSRRVQEVLRSEAPVFRAKSIDEFEMDVTGCERLFSRNFGGMVGFAEHVRRRVREEVGLKLSIGIGPSRLVAKMASRHAKPDGVYRVPPEEVERFLTPHDVQAVPGIGPATAATLRSRGVDRVEQLLALPRRMLLATFGIGMPRLLDALTGNGDEEHGPYFGYEETDLEGGVKQKRQPKSIGHESTFARDESSPEAVERTLWRLTEDACRRLRAANLRTRHVTVKIRYSDFATLTHGAMLEEPTDTDSAVFAAVRQLFCEGHTKSQRCLLYTSPSPRD